MRICSLMKNLIPLIIGLLVLSGLYWQVDIVHIIKIILQANTLWLAIGIGMVMPITMLTALRLVWLVPSKNQLSYVESLKLILAASTMNMLLPSKMGDVAKGLFIANDDGMNHVQALSLVMFEKISDLLALLLWCVFGLVLIQQDHWLFLALALIIIIVFVLGISMLTSINFSQSVFQIIRAVLPFKLEEMIDRFRIEWNEMILYLNFYKKRFVGIIFYSIFLWLLHLCQIWVFILALNVFVPFIDNLALTPLVILIGLMPLTLAGIGTRDAAFVFIYTSYFTAATGAALGLFATLRYLIPALFGIPFLSRYMSRLIVEK